MNPARKVELTPRTGLYVIVALLKDQADRGMTVTPMGWEGANCQITLLERAEHTLHLSVRRAKLIGIRNGTGLYLITI